jgi:hypothetical protein
MKMHILYMIIGALLAGNVALLLEKAPLSHPAADGTEQPGFSRDRVMQLDSLVLRRWSDGGVVRVEFTKPTFLFLFSKTSCPTCVEKVVDFLTRHATPAAQTYVVSSDIHDSEERIPYDARFLRSLPFYTLESLRRPAGLDVGLPMLMVVNNQGEILYVKQVLPTDDLQGDYLFWKRINFLYSLLAL